MFLYKVSYLQYPFCSFSFLPEQKSTLEDMKCFCHNLYDFLATEHWWLEITILRGNFGYLLKFGLSEKHTKFEKIFLMVLTNQLIYLVNVKAMRKIFSNYVCQKVRTLADNQNDIDPFYNPPISSEL